MKYGESIQAVRAADQMAFSAIGSLWMLGWCLQKHVQDLSTLCVVLLAGAAIFLWAWCDHRAARSGYGVPGARRFQSAGGSGVGSALEGLLCGAGLLFNLVFALELLGHPGWLPPILMMLTSLACLALGKAAQYRPHYLTGFALLSVALAYPLIAAVPNHAAACFAAGSILWISALYGLFVEHVNAGRVVVPAGRRSPVLFLRQESR
ncbi:hypothetical protein CY652_13540 [Burkholderia sp. WAC0059]|uniref:hypothetical protein n=1 Tax=Burkholderia sp. WAC0059 TaxID=2066022 RepID=UPI000C7E9106|nr:hypothetical protein [Burkholderia sp. WAC0059]PLZ02039.1 hypothetical protein CY652_13540 [Burkholderia sp. WAC0059]